MHIRRYEQFELYNLVQRPIGAAATNLLDQMINEWSQCKQHYTSGCTQSIHCTPTDRSTYFVFCMPTKTDRAILLRCCERLLVQRIAYHVWRLNNNVSDDRSNQTDQKLARLFLHLLSSRYLYQRVRSEARPARFTELLCGQSDSDFRNDFRLSRQQFWELHSWIMNSSQYKSDPRRQYRSQCDLLVCLYRMGHYGNAASVVKVAKYFGISIGAVGKFTDRAIEAILTLQEDAIQWPSAVERRSISMRIPELPGCVGLADGTLFPLESKPSQYGEDYYTRKCSYAINCTR